MARLLQASLSCMGLLRSVLSAKHCAWGSMLWHDIILCDRDTEEWGRLPKWKPV